MTTLKRNHKLSKSILLFTITTLLLNTTLQTHAAVGDTWRRVGSSIKETLQDKLPSLISKTKSSVKAGVASVYKKVQGFDRKILIDKLLGNVAKLGGQIGKIKDCMLFGSQCSSSERAAFYATAITILALTAAVVGFTITIAATSEEPDRELSQAIESTSQEVQGWKPEAVFQRLSFKLLSFKQGLLSMQECLSTRKCSRQQKRTLYATAATIVALVTVAIGIGIGSYLYAERKRKPEGAALSEEVAPSADTPEDLSMEEFDDNPVTPTGLSRKINILKGKARTLKEAYDAARQATIDQVRKLATKTAGKITDARTKIHSIQEQASQAFLDTLNKSSNFFSTVIEETIGVNTQTVRKKVEDIRGRFNEIEHLFVSTGKEKLFSFQRGINDLLAYFGQIRADIKDASSAISKLSKTEIVGAKFKSYETLATKKTQLAQKIASLEEQQIRIRARLDEIAASDPSQYQDEIVQLTRANNRFEDEKLPLITEKSIIEHQYDIKRITSEYLNKMYSGTIERVNNLNLKPFGQAVNLFFKAFGNAVETVGRLPKQAGLAFIIPKAEAESSIQEIARGIYSLGEHIQKALSIQPVITTETRTVQSLVASVIKASTNPTFIWHTTKETFGQLRQHLPALKTKLKSVFGKLDPATTPNTPAQNLVEFNITVKAFLEQFSSEELKREFVQKIRSAPLQNIPRAPKILLSLVLEKMKPMQKIFYKTLTSSTEFIASTVQSIPAIFNLIYGLNHFMQLTEKEKPFFNQQIIEELRQISTESIEHLSRGTSQLLRALAAPAA